MAQTSDPKPLLLTLPAEILNRIATEVVTVIDQATGTKRPIRWQSYTVLARRHLGPARACKKLWTIAVPIYFGNNIFQLVQQVELREPNPVEALAIGKVQYEEEELEQFRLYDPFGGHGLNHKAYKKSVFPSMFNDDDEEEDSSGDDENEIEETFSRTSYLRRCIDEAAIFKPGDLELHTKRTGLQVLRYCSQPERNIIDDGELILLAMIAPATHLSLLKTIDLHIEIPAIVIYEFCDDSDFIPQVVEDTPWLTIVRGLFAVGFGYLDVLKVTLKLGKRAADWVGKLATEEKRRTRRYVQSSVNKFLKEAPVGAKEVIVQYPPELMVGRK